MVCDLHVDSILLTSYPIGMRNNVSVNTKIMRKPIIYNAFQLKLQNVN